MDKGVGIGVGISVGNGHDHVIGDGIGRGRDKRTTDGHVSKVRREAIVTNLQKEQNHSDDVVSENGSGSAGIPMNTVVDVHDGNGDENTLTIQTDPSIRRKPDETHTSSTISNNIQNVLEEERPPIPISHHPRYRYRWMPKENTSPQTIYSKPSIFHPIPVHPSDHKSTSGSTSTTWRKCPILPLHSHSTLSNATILKRIIDVSQRETLARQ